MAKSNRGLGKGLSALLGNIETPVPDGDKVVFLDIATISANPYQPRKHFDKSALQELSESIKRNGIIQPIIVSKKDGAYYLVAGERRMLAAKMAGKTTIPCLVKTYTDQQFMLVSLIENIQRRDLSPLEKADSFNAIIQRFQLTHSEFSAMLGIDRSNITNHLRLLKLPAEIKQLLRSGRLSMGHCRALLGLKDSRSMIRLASRIMKDSLSVNQVEKLVQAAHKEKKPAKPQPKDSHVTALQTQLMDALKTKVALHVNSKGKGHIKINFFDAEDFQRIFDYLVQHES